MRANSRGPRFSSNSSTKQQSMKLNTSIGTLLLAIYLILIGVSALFGLRLGQAEIVKPILALIAGVLLLVGR
jgi:uncharacterized membrane protein